MKIYKCLIPRRKYIYIYIYIYICICCGSVLQSYMDTNQTPLLLSSSSSSSSSALQPPSPSDHAVKRTGGVYTAVAHIITGVIGSGVLSLAWSMAQLGWIAGPSCMLLFALISLASAFLLSNCYRSQTQSPSPPSRNPSYLQAVRSFLGRRSAWLCGTFVQIYLLGIGVAYTITSASSMRAIQKSNCYHKEGHEAACKFKETYYMLLFGGVQIVMSQIPDFHNMEWLSIVAAIMSFSYSSIGFALGLAKVIGDGKVKGSITGVPTSTMAQKVWLVSQAIGDIAFAYPFPLILLEVQDTLKSPPPENQSMKKASMIAICITTVFYLCCGGFGYAAFGNSTPGNLLTGFGFYEPYWLIDFANACIVVHLVGGYQVYSQPQFAAVERWSARKFPNSGIVKNYYTLRLPFLPAIRLSVFRLCFRSVYVAMTTGLAMMLPYFNQVLGVLGAMNFWALSIYFPVEMYFVQKGIAPWTRMWVVLQIFSITCLLVTVFAFIGSVEGLIAAKFS
ncbi:probable amino acid permease 7 [Malania oleifera]|uniref:probable amino acid permease 7 n=1 Tax=Malania oleifera TaxID=397392 RepID=UPI0025ADFEFE|nr:probable amino acid permease 7 [Malania oleifera]